MSREIRDSSHGGKSDERGAPKRASLVSHIAPGVLLILVDSLAGALSHLGILDRRHSEVKDGLRTPVGRFPLMITGAIDLVVAIILAIDWERLDIPLISMLIAMSLMASGPTIIRASVRLRRLNHRFGKLGHAWHQARRLRPATPRLVPSHTWRWALSETPAGL